jgi:hypothetical protein
VYWIYFSGDKSMINEEKITVEDKMLVDSIIRSSYEEIAVYYVRAISTIAHNMDISPLEAHMQNIKGTVGELKELKVGTNQ